MTIRHGYLYDFQRACHVEGRIKISLLSNSQVIFQDKKERKKLAQAKWKLTLEKPLWAFRGGIWNSSGHKLMSMKCVDSQKGKHICGKSLHLQPCWTNPGRAQHLKT